MQFMVAMYTDKYVVSQLAPASWHFIQYKVCGGTIHPTQGDTSAYKVHQNKENKFPHMIKAHSGRISSMEPRNALPWNVSMCRWR